MSPLAIEWAWLVVPLLALLPAAGAVGACVVAWRSGWHALLAVAFAWAVAGFLLFGVLLPGASATAGVSIALFLFLMPALLCGSIALLARQRRESRRPADQR